MEKDEHMVSSNATTQIAEEILSKRKTTHQLRVEAFHRIMRLLGNMGELPEKPFIPAPSMLITRAKLILEEVLELFEACGVGLRLKVNESDTREPNFFSEPLTYKNFKLTTEKVPDIQDLPEIAKELADVSVVTTGTFIEFGICDEVILEEVDRNNLQKFSEGGYLDENRKWRKPINHPKPDLIKHLKNQGWD